MKFSFGGEISLVALMGGGKNTQMFDATVDGDLGLEFRSMRMATKEASLAVNVGAPLILHIHDMRDFAKVCESIVGRISIDMINVAVRKSTVYV